MAKTLIAFFSRADENYFGGAMRYVKVGNTEIVAGIIKDLIPADSFKIEMKNPYSPVYMTCIEEAKKDLRAKARPELASVPGSIDEYDTVILAYPNYWERCRWPFTPSWRASISPARPSFRSAPTKEAAWARVNARSRRPAPAQMSRRACPSPAARPQAQRAAWSAG